MLDHKGAVFVNLLAPLFLFILPRVRMYIFFSSNIKKTIMHLQFKAILLCLIVF